MFELTKIFINLTMGNTFQYVFLHSNNAYLGCSTIYYRISYSLSHPTLDTVLRCHRVSVKKWRELSAQPEMLDVTITHHHFVEISGGWVDIPKLALRLTKWHITRKVPPLQKVCKFSFPRLATSLPSCA